MKQQSFKGQHFIIHLNKEMERLNKERLKDYPYDMIVASQFAYPPMSREELKGLADFINEFLEEDNAT
jgi:hypothetical protein